MARVCARPGCDRFAVARLTYDTIACQVWLDPVLERPGRAQEICDLHATRLTVPRGWVLCDRRAEPPASSDPEAATNGTAVRTSVTSIGPLADRESAAEAEPAAEQAPDVDRPAETQPAQVDPPETPPREIAASVAPTVPAAPPAARSHPARRPISVADDPVEPVHPARRRVARTVALPLSELVRDESGHNGDGAHLAEVTQLEVGPDPAEEGPSEVAESPVDEVAAHVDEVPVDEQVDGDEVPVDEQADEEPLEEDLPESLQATSPLLARAFRLSAPQGSVLSRALLNEPD